MIAGNRIRTTHCGKGITFARLPLQGSLFAAGRVSRVRIANGAPKHDLRGGRRVDVVGVRTHGSGRRLFYDIGALEYALG